MGLTPIIYQALLLVTVIFTGVLLVFYVVHKIKKRNITDVNFNRNGNANLRGRSANTNVNNLRHNQTHSDGNLVFERHADNKVVIRKSDSNEFYKPTYDDSTHENSDELKFRKAPRYVVLNTEDKHIYVKNESRTRYYS